MFSRIYYNELVNYSAFEALAIDGGYCCQIKISPAIKELANQTELFDFKLEGHDGSIELHACLASVFSPVFKTAILSGFKEAKDRQMDVSPYTLKTLEMFRDFVYHGRLIITHNTVFELLQFTHEYQISDMFHLCEKYFCQQSVIHLKNEERLTFFVKAFKYGIIFGSETVRKASEREICDLIKLLPSSDEFLELEPKYIASLVLMGADTKAVVLGLCSWLLFKSGREESLHEVLSTWLFSFLDAEQVNWNEFLANEFFCTKPLCAETVYLILGKYYVRKSIAGRKVVKTPRKTEKQIHSGVKPAVGFDFTAAADAPPTFPGFSSSSRT